MRGTPVTVLCASGSDQIWTWIRKRAESDPGPTALGPSSQCGWVFLRKSGPWAPSLSPRTGHLPSGLKGGQGKDKFPGTCHGDRQAQRPQALGPHFGPRLALPFPVARPPEHTSGVHAGHLPFFPHPPGGWASFPREGGHSSGLRLRARTLPGQLRALVSGWRVGSDGHRQDTSSGPTAGPTPPPPQPLPSSQGCPLPPPGHCGSPGPRQRAPMRWPSHWFTPPPPNSSWNGTKSRG